MVHAVDFYIYIYIENIFWLKAVARDTSKIFHSPFSRKRLLVSEKVNVRRHAATKSSAHSCNFFVVFLSLFFFRFFLFSPLFFYRTRISKRVRSMQRNGNAAYGAAATAAAVGTEWRVLFFPTAFLHRVPPCAR